MNTIVSYPQAVLPFDGDEAVPLFQRGKQVQAVFVDVISPAIAASQTAKAWAESPTPPVTGSESAKTWALKATAVAAAVRVDASSVAVNVDKATQLSAASGRSADTAAGAEAGVLAAIAGNPIAAVVQLQAVSRNALAALTETTQGRQAHLSEPSQDGDFNLLPADPGADIIARQVKDVDRGLYVKQGNGRIWARVRTRRVYEAAWMLGSGARFTDAQVPLQRMVDLMEPCSTLSFPAAEMELSSCLDARVQGLHIQGAPGQSSFLKANAGNVAYWSGRPLAYLRCNDVVVDGMKLQHIHSPPNVQAGGGFCLEISNNDVPPEQTGGFQQKNVTVRNSRFQDCSEGFVVYCNNRNGADASKPGGFATDPANIYKVKGVRGYHNDFVGLGYQSMSIFGCEDVDLHDFSIIMAPMDRPGFTPNLRILGTENIRVHDFDLYGTGLIGFGGDQRSLGVAVLAANTRGTRMFNRNVTIDGFTIRNSRYPFAIVECHGDLVIQNGVVDNDRNSTENTALAYSVDVPLDQFSPVLGNNVDRLTMRNINAQGCANGPLLYGRYGSIDIDKIDLLGNSRAPNDDVRALQLQANDQFRYQFVRLRNSTFLLPDNSGNVVVEVNQGGPLGSSADYIEVTGNTLPVGLHINGAIYKTGRGSIRTAMGGPVQLAGEWGAAAMGMNHLAPAGLFERMRSGAA